jgi:hypothetical protein
LDCLHSTIAGFFDGEFADLAEDFVVFLELVNWIKSEVELDEKELFYYLATNMHSVTFDDSMLIGGL